MRKQRLHIFFGLLLLCGIGTLSSCATPSPYYGSQQVKGVSSSQKTSDVLGMNSVHVIRQGESISIVIPSDVLFEYTSANPRQNNPVILGRVAHMVKQYNTSNIKVAAYTDSTAHGVDADNSSYALTVRQAQMVSSFLWAHGIDTRLLTAKGYGSKDSVASNSTPQGQYDNRRVEISFRYTPKYVAYN